VVERAAITPSAAREAGLAARRSLGPDRRRTLSLAAGRRLVGLPELEDATLLAGYLALPFEVDLADAQESLRSDGRVLHLPKVDDDATGPHMRFVEWRPGAEIVANRFGVGEVEGPTVALSELSAVIVPCVAVAADGTRVGFGAGYYDRALAGAPEPVRIGVAFEVQVVDRIDRQAWDVPMDVVVTDSSVRRWKRSR
jgi:5-formyltetrahydrofolate cyclo-ligase